MKIVVAYKWAPNPQDAQVLPDGTVDWARAKSGVSEYDPVAFELARQLADATGGEVVGLTVGPASIDSPLARKAALSKGLDRLVVVADDALVDADGTRLAAVLAAAVTAVGDVDVVLAGESSVDVGDGQVPATLAGALGWVCLAGVRSLADSADGLVVERDRPGGTETLRLAAPAVLAVTADAAVPRVPGMKDILGAAKKPTEVLALEGLDVAATVPVTVLGRARPEQGTRRAVMIDATDPQAAATELVAALRQSGVL